jgi:CRP/FNR family transcriptional regulator
MLGLYKLLADGRRQVVGFLVPGDFLGLAFGRTYVHTAEAITPVAACRFPRARFMGLLEEFPALERDILSRTSNELAAAQRQMLLLGRKTARERLASFLVDLAERSDADGGPLELPMGRADIADHLGLTIETVSRTFTGLRREGVIDLPSAHRLVVRKPGELARIAAC